ncbi:MAG: hypothetical protein CHACPFDD_03801 [Phycisphaerae bacterium]|nr:hypothetical protein [Phycisphaerae bacterium]
MLQRMTAFFVLLTPLAAGGCTTVIKQAYYEVRGAHGKVNLVNDVEAATLLPYVSLKFEPATTTLGEKLCPPVVLEEFDRAGDAASLAVTEELPGGAPGLTVATEVVYFKKKGLFSGAQCLARVKARDAARLVLDAVVEVESRAFRAGDEDDLAEASVKALADYVSKQKKKARKGDTDKDSSTQAEKKD